MKNILFVCVHNAGRSKMAEAIFNSVAKCQGLPARASSAGTIAGEQVNPLALQALREIDIEPEEHGPRQLTQGLADRADRVISMGCGVDAEACPVRFLIAEDWKLEDPAGQSIEKVRAIRDEIHAKVVQLIKELEP